MDNQPEIKVGILVNQQVTFLFNGLYQHEGTLNVYSGENTVVAENGKVKFLDSLYDFLLFKPVDYQTAFFELPEVTIGIDFHWEKKESQSFQGALKLVVENQKIRVINVIRIEDYLESVISSEMKATSSAELLKTHAVISRSWLLAQLNKKDTISQNKEIYKASFVSENEIIRWYDREDHTGFDVCADDHCQRYQGITRISTSHVKEAVKNTFGEVIVSGNEICDARFSKCCGGITEEFQNCWEPVPHSYLKSVFCNHHPPAFIDYEHWIETKPDAFCNTTDKSILFQVLNEYDLETPDFYRWEATYAQHELSELIKNKSGIDFGNILDLIPIERGKSGRIIRLLVKGSKKEMYIGKELEIRKILSSSHLYSSAFTVKKEDIKQGIPGRFILKGAGWGHGVGLCQIGAAVMAVKNYDYKEILHHYFTGISIKKLY